MMIDERFHRYTEWVPRLIAAIGLFASFLGIGSFFALVPSIAAIAMILTDKQKGPGWKLELAYSSIAAVLSLFFEIYYFVSTYLK